MKSFNFSRKCFLKSLNCIIGYIFLITSYNSHNIPYSPTILTTYTKRKMFPLKQHIHTRYTTLKLQLFFIQQISWYTKKYVQQHCSQIIVWYYNGLQTKKGAKISSFRAGPCQKHKPLSLDQWFDRLSQD